MKKISDFLFSSKLTLVLLLLFAAAIGSATFIEEKYDTVTARLLVYDTKWLELIMLLLAVNFIGIIQRYNLFRKEKLAALLFHLAFILLIVGAGITRYVSFEGMMHIREGNETNIMSTSSPYIQIRAKGQGVEYSYDKPVEFSEYVRSGFHKSIQVKDKGEIEISFHDYFQNAVHSVNENVPGGSSILQLVVGGVNGRETILLTEGEIADIGEVHISYNNDDRGNAIHITKKDGKLFLISPSDIVRTLMHGNGMNADSTANIQSTDSILELIPKNIYTTQGLGILFVKEFVNAKKELVRGSAGDKGSEVLLLDVTYNGKTQEIPVFTGNGNSTEFREVDLDGIKLYLAYGNKEIALPFSLRLDDFILDRYAGSMSPSSFASKITLVDPGKNLRENHRIFMNNVLDYEGYRFFQSSYDMDEKGTILSVNHDFYGTWISYLGYFLLGVGFILALVNKNSRFHKLKESIRQVRNARKAGLIVMVVFLFGLNGIAVSQSRYQPAVSKEHAEKFGHLIVQTYDGRFEPMHTLAYDVVHKISRKDQYHSDVKGDLDDMQLFIDMILDQEFWKQQKLVYIREKSVSDIIGVDGKFASFYDFIDPQSAYKLSSYVEDAFRKKASEQNSFDKELIRVDERLNVWLTLMNGSILKIFPLQGSDNHRWISFADTLASRPLSGSLREINRDLPLNDLNYHNIMVLYFQSLVEAAKTNDYKMADKLLADIETIQRQETPAELLPSKKMVSLEIFYNKSQIFVTLKNIYGILSLVLLILAFIDNLRSRRSMVITWLLNIFIGLLGIAFLYHSYGMGLRWYLTGHAPWSNGYEALLLVAWGSLLAGFYFMRYSKITLAATALLAFSVLMTAGHSSYDPQLTNLQPVLKSYWLIIHVAVITISYGFLALGFVLGLINLFIYLFKTTGNAFRLDLIIKELTFTNEMALTIGIVMATLGTFLGGVWANESWGRYWGWDAKETWALVIVITYAVILHLRMVPKLRSTYIFNVASIVGFGSVIMTFVGVNYYLSKGLHSYAADEKQVFPFWAWGMILSMILLMIAVGVKESLFTKAAAIREEERN